jgi:hypothetical protein
MVKALFDTNILIDFLNGVPQAKAEIGAFSEKSISVITWMEVMAGAPKAVAPQTRAFLGDFEMVGVNANVAERAVGIRQARKIKLPDAIVWASAQAEGALLVTRNTKDFPVDPGVRHPYIV